MNKLYGNQIPSNISKRPIVTMDYIEANTIKMKMDQVKALVRYNAKRLEDLLRQPPSESSNAPLKKHQPLSERVPSNLFG